MSVKNARQINIANRVETYIEINGSSPDVIFYVAAVRFSTFASRECADGHHERLRRRTKARLRDDLCVTYPDLAAQLLPLVIQLIIDPDVTQAGDPKRFVQRFSVQQTVAASRSPHDSRTIGNVRAGFENNFRASRKRGRRCHLRTAR